MKAQDIHVVYSKNRGKCECLGLPGAEEQLLMNALVKKSSSMFLLLFLCGLLMGFLNLSWKQVEPCHR